MAREVRSSEEGCERSETPVRPVMCPIKGSKRIVKRVLKRHEPSIDDEKKIEVRKKLCKEVKKCVKVVYDQVKYLPADILSKAFDEYCLVIQTLLLEGIDEIKEIAEEEVRQRGKVIE